MSKVKIWFYSVTGIVVACGLFGVIYDEVGAEKTLKALNLKVPTKTITKIKTKEVEKEKVTFEQALAERLKTSTLPRILVDGVLLQEDGSRSGRMSLTRFEQSYMNRAAKITNNQDEQRMWASSWCPFQVMAPHVKSFKLNDWSELLDPETCVHIGMSILERCWKDARGSNKLDRVRRTGKCYNGGDAYAERLVRHVSQAAIEEIL